MKAAETDSDAVAGAEPIERKRASGALSLLVTAVVVIGSVVAVYSIFPNRWLHVAERALEAHRDTSPAYELAAPNRDQLVAWSVGVLGAEPPWPRTSALTLVIGARSLDISGRPAAHAVYDVDGFIISIVAQRSSHDPGRRVDAGDLAITWQRGPWTLVAVGPASDHVRWTASLGIP